MRFKLWPEPPAELAGDDDSDRDGDSDHDRDRDRDRDRDSDRDGVSEIAGRRQRALEAVLAARDALPLVPGSEDDCCARLMDRRGFERRDVARTWITFLRALELAEETDDGYRRRRGDVDRDDLARAARENVFGVEESLAVLAGADGPLTAEAVFERLRDRIPQWERHKQPREWAERWAGKVASLLQWCVLFGLLDERDGGYVVADGVAVEGT